MTQFSTQVDPKIYALVAAALKRKIDLANWATGGLSTRMWLDHLLDSTSLHVHLLGLERLSVEQRKAVIETCSDNQENIPDFFAELRLKTDQAKNAKSRGAIFTPLWLVNRIVKNTADHWHRLNRSGRQPQTIADLSCGVGAFLYSASNRFPSVETSFYGIDCDADSIFYASLLEKAVSNRRKWHLEVGDSLVKYSNHEPANKPTFDILLGNPPYVRSQLLSPEYTAALKLLETNFTRGNFDLSVLFLKQAIDMLPVGGVASYLLSSKFTTSKYGKPISDYLVQNCRVLNIEDYGDMQLFDNQTTYTCVITFAKLPPSKRFSVTQFLTSDNGSRSLGKGQTHTLPTERLNKHPWDFTHGVIHDSLAKLRNSKHIDLLSVFDSITQGIRTGANRVFVLSDAPAIESEHLIPFVGGENIRRLRINESHPQLVFPYIINALGGIRLLAEHELELKPGLRGYLLEHRGELEERTRDSEPWYSYSRSQNLGVFSIRKVLVREMMPRAEFAADFEGKYAFSSGYALLASSLSDEDLLMWTVVLNTPTMEFSLRQHSTQLHSGWFRLLKHYINRVKLPSFSARQRSAALELAVKLNNAPDDKELMNSLDSLVANAFDLLDTERTAIGQYLHENYVRSLPNYMDTFSEMSSRQIYDSVHQLSNPSLEKYEPVRLEQYDVLHRDRRDLHGAVTFVPNKKLPIHRWYPYTQGFSASLVTELLEGFGASKKSVVLDPFTGCGTTNVVCRLSGITSIGLEISPFASWLATAKVQVWSAEELENILLRITQLPIPPRKPSNLLFDKYLEKAYHHHILEQLYGIAFFAQTQELSKSEKDYLLLGLIGITESVSKIRKHGSHYRFLDATENIGLQKLNTQLVSSDANIYPIYLDKLNQILLDIIASPMLPDGATCSIITESAFSMPIPDNSIDFVITSPPYLNRNNYLAQQKAEMSLLSTVNNLNGYKALVEMTMRSHVEGSFADKPKTQFKEVEKIIRSIELTEGNNKKIPHMIAGYFEDMDKVLGELSRVVKRNGSCAFVVGNSRWGGVVVPVDHLLLLIAEKHGFKPERVLVTRMKGNSPQQMRRYGRIPVRESIVIFRKI